MISKGIEAESSSESFRSVCERLSPWFTLPILRHQPDSWAPSIELNEQEEEFTRHRVGRSTKLFIMHVHAREGALIGKFPGRRENWVLRLPSSISDARKGEEAINIFEKHWNLICYLQLSFSLAISRFKVHVTNVKRRNWREKLFPQRLRGFRAFFPALDLLTLLFVPGR